MSFIRHTLAGFFGALAGWILLEPWSSDYGVYRETLLLYAVAFGITCLLVVEKYVYAGRYRLAKATFKRWPIYVWPAVAVALVQILFAGTVRESGLDTTPEERLLLLDVSSSMRGRGISELKRAGETYLDLLESSSSVDKVGAIAFSSDASVIAVPSADYSALTSAIDGLSAYGDTNMLAALQQAMGVFGGPGDLPQEIVLVSDGQPTNDPRSILAFVAQMEGVVIHTIGAGRGYNRGFLRRIADETGGQFYSANNLSGLSDAFLDLARKGITRERGGEDTLAIPVWRLVSGWSLFGLMVGLAVGWLSRANRSRMIVVGVVGGTLGGALSAILFWLLDLLALGGATARGVSFSLLGLTLGFCIFLAGEIYTRVTGDKGMADFSSLTGEGVSPVG